MKTKSSFKYLNKGFIEVLEVSGTDTDIALAARTSYNEDEYEDPSRNNSLIDYLVRHKHTSPIEFPSITFKIKMPIFVMRQHIRHRTASINEVSLRYITHDGDYWVPSINEVRNQSKSNKQGSEGVASEEDALQFIKVITDVSDNCWNSYNSMVSLGIAKEQCRAMLPVNFYTTCVWQMDLHNLLHYLKLRTGSHAQREIVEMAEIVENVVKEHFPVTYRSWMNHVKNAVTFSSDEFSLLKEYMEIGNVDTTLSKSRKAEFDKKIGQIFDFTSESKT